MSSSGRPTLRQVAELAGVSHQTVSRYFRAQSGLMPQTADRVKAAIDALGYRPNLAARATRTHHSHTLAVLLPGWDGTEAAVIAACDEARRAGYRVEIIIDWGEGPESLSSRVEELLGSGQVEGVLSLSSIGPTVPATGVVVQAEQFDHRLRAVNEGVAEDQATMVELVERLAQLGHRNLLHVAGPQDWPSASQRKAGYLEACRRYGLTSFGEPSGAWHPEAGRKAIEGLPDDTPVTAVVAASDHIGMGVIGAALRRGWDVPGRLSVTGWDDLLLPRYAYPSLSTVVIDRASAGRRAMRRLITAVEGRHEPELPPARFTRVEFRESTAPPFSPQS